MQITATCLTSYAISRERQCNASDSPLKDRVTWNWRKSFFIFSMATIVAEIALAIFLRLPMVALLCGGAAICNLLLYRWSFQSESKISQEKHIEELSKVQDQANREKEALIQQHEAQRSKLSGELQAANALAEKDKELIETVKPQVEELKKEVEALKIKNKELQENPSEELKVAKAELAQLQTNIESLSQEYKTLEGKKTDLETKFEQTKNSMLKEGKLKSDILKAKLKELKEKCEKMQENFTAAEKDYAQMQEKIQAARAELEKLKAAPPT